MTSLLIVRPRGRTDHAVAISAGTLVAGLIALHVVAWVLVPSLATSNAMLDIIEGLAWGHEWQLGYSKGPPLFAWLVEAAARLSGGQLWAIYLTSQLCIALTLFAVWRLARRVTGEIEAALAVFLLEGVYYFTFPTPEFNEIILQMPFAALLGWTLHRALREDRLRDWILSGVLAGAGLWARYSMGAYIIPVALFILLYPAARRSLGRSGPYVATVTAVLIFLPHALWIHATDFISLRYVAQRAKDFHGAARPVLALLRFAGAQALALLPAALLLALLLPWRKSARWPASGSAEPFDRAYVWAVALGPFLTAVTLALLSGHGLRSMWGAPLWCFVTLLAVMEVPPTLTTLRLRRFAFAWSLVFLLPLLGFLVANLMPVPPTKQGRKSHFPGRMLAQTLTARWHEITGAPLRYVVGHTWLAGNVAFYSADRPSVFIDADAEKSPWIDGAALAEAGALLVWSTTREGLEMPAVLAAAFPQAVKEPEVLVRAPSRVLGIGWAVLLPRHGRQGASADSTAVAAAVSNREVGSPP